MMLFWDHFKSRQHFQKNAVFLSLKKSFSAQKFEKTILPKISKFKQKVLFFESLWKNGFCPYVQKINISKKMPLIWDYFEKVVNISRKITFFWDKFGKIVFLPISPKISKFKQKVLFFGSLWKIGFCSYV